MTSSHHPTTSTVENYLKSLYVHQQNAAERLVPLGRLAQALEVTPGTVTTMVKGLAEAGYAEYEARRGARLTETGEILALQVLRRHRLIELFLVEVMGYDWSEVHDDAEVLEHAVSDQLLERIDIMLGHPTVDPHGDPIPQASGRIDRQELQPLSLATVGWHEIARIMDHAPQFLCFLQERGLTPGAAVHVIERNEVAEIVRLEAPSREAVIVSMAAAARILVPAPHADSTARSTPPAPPDA